MHHTIFQIFLHQAAPNYISLMEGLATMETTDKLDKYLNNARDTLQEFHFPNPHRLHLDVFVR